MTAFEFVTGLFRQQARQLQYAELLPQQIDSWYTKGEAPPILQADGGYWRLWVSNVLLAHRTDWFATWYPAVQSVVRFQFGDMPQLEIANVAGPQQLKQIDERHLDRVVQLDYALTPLVPFRGGTVDVEVGLLAMQADARVQRFVDAIGGFASLLTVPQLSLAVSIADKVSQGMQQLLGVGSDHLVVGMHRTFAGADGAGGGDLRDSYLALINAPWGAYPRQQLWVAQKTLMVGPGESELRPLEGVDYLLLRLETRLARDDWESLTTISTPYLAAKRALLQPSEAVQLADASIKQAILAAYTSPDLTEPDRARVSALIKQRYGEAKRALALTPDVLEAVPRGTSAAVADGRARERAGALLPDTLGHLLDNAAARGSRPAEPLSLVELLNV